MENLREDILSKDKWNLSCFYKDEEEFFSDYQNIEKDLEGHIKKFKGKIMQSADNLYSFLKAMDNLNLRIDHICSYASLLSDTDTTNDKYQKLEEKTVKLMEKYANEIAFAIPEILKKDYKIFLKENKKLKDYEFYLEKIFRTKSHMLSVKEEEIISKASNALGLANNVFKRIDNSDINLGYIKDEKSKRVELTNSNYSYYIKSTNRKIRKDAFNKMYKYYRSLKHTISANYIGQIKENFFYSGVRKFKNPLEKNLFYDTIDIKVYEMLINSVRKGLPVLHDYFRVKKNVLKVDVMYMYDVYAEVGYKINSHYEYEDAKKIVLNSLTPLGKEYEKKLKEAFVDNWIDVYPSRGKRSGGYCSGFAKYHPNILLNYNKTLGDVSTLAHELGHAMHSYYSWKNQAYVYNWYGIFLAEIASTVNELLLSDYLLKNANSKEEKLAMLFDLMEKNRATFYRQAMFAEFEKKIHDKYEQKDALTTEELCNTYYELNREYFGDFVVSDNTIKYEWMRIPHFYSSFYVYKYATGITAALTIVEKLLNKEKDFAEKYLKFLATGGSKYPLDALKELGIDMTKSEPFENVINFFEKRIKQIEELVETSGRNGKERLL